MECFFLHAKAQASGLNLINATHVFLCEPLINTAIELQVIARVHRIGQNHPTTVWMYLVEGTVEKAIYNISVHRRMLQIGKAGKPRTEDSDKGETFQNHIDIANALEPQYIGSSTLLSKSHSGGEIVDENDLWNCLFLHQTENTTHSWFEPQQELQEMNKHINEEDS